MLLVIFVMLIFYFIFILKIINKYLFFILINNFVYKNILIAFVEILVLIEIRLHIMLKVF